MENNFDLQMAQRLKDLRQDNNMSLVQLSARCGISRASLSRLENAEVSPTAIMLGKLCATYNITMSRLMSLVEADFAALIPSASQEVWVDPESGLKRTIISPPSATLSAEMLKCSLPKNQTITYENTPKSGLEHHIYMLEGQLELTVAAKIHTLKKGDCLRYQLHGKSQFKTKGTAAKYILTLI